VGSCSGFKKRWAYYATIDYMLGRKFIVHLVDPLNVKEKPFYFYDISTHLLCGSLEKLVLDKK